MLGLDFESGINPSGDICQAKVHVRELFSRVLIEM